MTKRLLLITLLTITLTTACTRAASNSPPTELPINFPSPAPGSTPLCQPADLQTSSNSIETGEALLIGLTLTNQTKNPCALTNPPQVALLAGANQPLQTQLTAMSASQTPPAPAELQLAPGESVIISLVWNNYCQPLPNDHLSIRLALSATQNLDVATRILAAPRCDAKNAPSLLKVAPYSYPP